MLLVCRGPKRTKKKENGKTEQILSRSETIDRSGAHCMPKYSLIVTINESMASTQYEVEGYHIDRYRLI